MFKVYFIKYVFDSDKEDANAGFAVLTREEKLPFTPMVGLEIQWPFIRNQKIVSVTWNCDKQLFTCRMENEYTENLDVDAPDFDEYIETAPSLGWAVASVYPSRV